MSEENKDQTQPLETEPLTSSMMRKTSSVPLRKETVRVTLKSVPTGALGNAPSAAPRPGAPKPAAMTQDTSPQSSALRTGSNPNVPDVTSAVPLKQETMRVTLKADPTSQTSVKPAEPGKPVGTKPMIGKKPASPVPPASKAPSAPVAAMKPPVVGGNAAPKAPSNPNIPDVTSAVPLRKETMAVTLKADPTAQTAVQPAAPKAPSSPVAAMKPPVAGGNTAPKAPSNPNIPDVTSAVPLKKETMAVTLKADPTAQTAVQPASPKAPAAPVAGAPKAPVAPVAGAAKAPALGAPKAPGTPALSAAPKMASPAPTIALNTPKVATPTKPLGTPALSQPLPQATVQLEKTQQLKKPDAPSAAASFEVSDAEEEEVEAGADKAILYLVAACFALSLFVLFAQFQQASVWVDEHKGGDMGAIFSD